MADTNNKYSFLDYAGLTLFWNKVKKVIEDNELVTASALTDLDTRVDNLEKESENTNNITYTELVNLRNTSKLTSGRFYRITDYITTTTQANTQSAGHQFDIIVVADDVNALNENARAIQHDGDTYFADSDLNAWQLWYCLDNDTSRFAWADATNGKGVIYRMIDEFGNDCPYDFKNIQFARWELSNPEGYRNDYDFENGEDNWIRESTPFGSLKTGFYGLTGSDNVFTYVYNDDNEDYAHYKYKVEYTISESPTYCYTFGKDTDYSMNGNNYGNIIKEYKSSKPIRLNNIVFFGNGCSRNSFGNGCSRNSFGNDCHDNSFGNGCYDNSFIEYCYSNSFGDGCSSNSFGRGCDYNSFGTRCYVNSFEGGCIGNSFGNDCYNNSFGDRCSRNSFGNDCNRNSFGDDCSRNSFGNECYRNSFGNYCYNNSFGNYCYNNSFGGGCSSNSFGGDCYDNSFGNGCSSNSFGNKCSYNSFGNGCSSNSFGNYCYVNSFRVSGDNTSSLISYCRYNAFDDGCSYNIIYSPNTNASNYLENYHINRGVKGTYLNPMLIDAQYLNAENVCNVYRKGDVAIVSYIQY